MVFFRFQNLRNWTTRTEAHRQRGQSGQDQQQQSNLPRQELGHPGEDRVAVGRAVEETSNMSNFVNAVKGFFPFCPTAPPLEDDEETRLLRQGGTAIN